MRLDKKKKEITVTPIKCYQRVYRAIYEALLSGRQIPARGTEMNRPKREKKKKRQRFDISPANYDISFENIEKLRVNARTDARVNINYRTYKLTFFSVHTA